ncbi:unnamed protein product [Prorocentrum cordatum]|uniref:Orn/DAP/Arg decarboxylase 2 N-terminal domain-containing protein n=1 Tax=Prorocentrum cordatum TaxID=2364126 RepID=A0ABN9T998_9DINO|nr:unnamed protein product [Polarella glacialis]
MASISLVLLGGGSLHQVEGRAMRERAMAPSCRGAVTLALLLHDLAWVSFVPEAGVLAMLAGLVLQAKLVREEQGKCPLEHAVALALRDLGGGSRHPRPILLLDLGRVSRALAAWRSELPRLVPQFPVGQDADRKTVQLLHAERCCFTCTTLPEIRLALSLGISPKDIFFAQPRKPRPHLSFAREHGVELMTFEDRGPRSVAAEHAGARLLLSVACSEERGGSAEAPPFAVRFGAQRDSWRPLLELAAGLGLSVVGVSLSCGPRRASCLGEALGAAREAMSLAVACGFEVTVLEVGGAFAALAGGGQAAQSADDVEGHLRRRFPSAAWPGLRILAEPGRHVAQGAVALLTPGRAPLAGGSERCSPSGGRWGTFGSPCAVDWSGEDMPAVSSPSTRWLLWQALPTGSPSDGTAAWRAAPPAAAPPVPQPQLPTAAPTVWYFSEEEVS